MDSSSCYIGYRSWQGADSCSNGVCLLVLLMHLAYRASTGVKCLPHDKLSQIGDCIHDSHAEVLARRSFVRCVEVLSRLEHLLMYRWLLSEMLHILHDSTYHSVLLQYIDQDRRFDLRPDVDFHLYVSQAPCELVLYTLAPCPYPCRWRWQHLIAGCFTIPV